MELETDWFVKRYGLKRKVKTIEKIVNQVDIGFIQPCNLEKHIEEAQPFFDNGKLAFITHCRKYEGYYQNRRSGKKRYQDPMLFILELFR